MMFRKAISLFLMIIFLLGCQKKETPREITIGVVLPLTGPLAAYGIDTRRGLELALREVNQNGGVKGFTLRLDVRDNQGKPLESASITQTFASGKYMFIIGPLLTNNTLAAATVAQEAGIPLITPAATGVSVTEVGDYISRICFVDPYQANAMANFAYFNLGLRNLRILAERDNTYSENLAKYFSEKFEHLSGTKVSKLILPEDPGEIAALVNSLKDENVEGIYTPIYLDKALKFLEIAAEQKVSIIILGSDSWDSRDFLNHIYDLVSENRQVFFTTQFSENDSREEVAAFLSKYQQEFGEAPTTFGALGYDALMLGADALNRTTSLSRKAVKEAINSTRNFTGVTGYISLNEKRNAVKNVYIVEVEKGGVFLKTAINALF
jgi:branched-chain amino acid transport system substrate-binding protein